MIVILATMKAKPDKAAAFEALGKELAEKTKAGEPGNQLYRLHKGADGTTFLFYEIYDNDAAVAAHMQSPHFQAAMPKFKDLLDGPPKIERLTIVAG